MIKIINVNWSNQKSVDQAEKQQNKLINQGYNLIQTINSFTTTNLIYKLIK